MTKKNSESRLLNLRRQQVKLAELQALHVSEQIEKLNERLAAHQTELQNLDGSSAKQHLSGLLQANQLALHLRVRQDKLASQLEMRKAAHIEATDKVIQARIAANAMSRLHKLRISEERRLQAKRDQQFLDEVAHRKTLGGRRV